jgi:hypothetical protein
VVWALKPFSPLPSSLVELSVWESSLCGRTPRLWKNEDRHMPQGWRKSGTLFAQTELFGAYVRFFGLKKIHEGQSG